jgi:hypothetical protein
MLKAMRLAAVVAGIGLSMLTGCSSAAVMGGMEDRGQAAPAADAMAPSPIAMPFIAPAPSAPAADAAKPEALVATTRPDAVARIIIYSATLRLVVPNVAQTMSAIRRSAEAIGGYLAQMDDQSITVRVPAARFNDALGACEGQGEVTGRIIKGQDITEEMHDLNLRLEAAEQVRKRLGDLVAKSEKMKDTLEIEKELERVIENIELLKGKVRFYSSQAAYATIRVELNSPLPQKQMVAQIPFPWVRQLGDGMVSGAAAEHPDTSRWRSRAVRFTLPRAYIRYYERENTCEAMSADGVLIKLQRQENYSGPSGNGGGELAFWGGLCRRALVENRAVAITREADTTLHNKLPVHLITGTKEVAGQRQGYLLAIVATESYVHVFEAWGPQEAFTRDCQALEEAVRTMEIDP